MGFWDFLFGYAAGENMMGKMGKRKHDQPYGIVLEDDEEAQFDDGYPDDYVGDGLDGTDDYLGDGLD